MSKGEEIQAMDKLPKNFCFKYCINLGDDKFGTMTINEKTNLYEEAQNFCKMYGLQPYIAVILQNQIFQQTLRIKEQIMNKQIKNGKSVGKIQKNVNNQSMQKINPSENKNTKNSLQKNKSKQKIRTSNLSQESVVIKASRIDIDKQKQKNQNISKHFENMFKKHEEIENKKQMSRKASYEKIPFKPIINNLSKKIVDLKRNAINNNNYKKQQFQKQSHTQKVYFKNKMKPIQMSQSKQKYNKQNLLNSEHKKITNMGIKQSRSKSKIIV